MTNEPLFIETLKIKEGQFIHPGYHLNRMKATQEEVFGFHIPVRISNNMIPADKRQGIVKCRILYGQDIQQINFETYHPKIIRSLKIVESNQTDYHLKYADRTVLTNLLSKRQKCDDILIVREKEITDTSYSNVVLFDGKEFHTPSSYLLNGTRRRYLLESGRIKESRITTKDLKYFEKLFLINAMLDIEDNIRIDIENIIP